MYFRSSILVTWIDHRPTSNKRSCAIFFLNSAPPKLTCLLSYLLTYFGLRLSRCPGNILLVSPSCINYSSLMTLPPAPPCSASASFNALHRCFYDISGRQKSKSIASTPQSLPTPLIRVFAPPAPLSFGVWRHWAKTGATLTGDQQRHQKDNQPLDAGQRCAAYALLGDWLLCMHRDDWKRKTWHRNIGKREIK